MVIFDVVWCLECLECLLVFIGFVVRLWWKVSLLDFGGKKR